MIITKELLDYAWKKFDYARASFPEYRLLCIIFDDKEPIRPKKVNNRLKSFLRWFKHQPFVMCQKCGEMHYSCLDFHHREPETKTDNIGTLTQGTHKRSELFTELLKCDILCANCHRKLHFP